MLYSGYNTVNKHNQITNMQHRDNCKSAYTTLAQYLNFALTTTHYNIKLAPT